ncbi:MAG: phosphonate C-P lyase system protein PhnH [Alphaproteobacteria bacterium]|nr:phosphonate C-P lyase system protein PhnH [Alphaproteobacteria bacterium]
MTQTVGIRPGFSDPVMGAQRSFRAVLDAMSRPGVIRSTSTGNPPPVPLSEATAAICLGLVDHDTPLWLAPAFDRPEVTAFLRFHCGCAIIDRPADAAFAITTGADLPPLGDFALGDDAYPEHSTTVIVQVDGLGTDGGLTLSGPGIETTHRLTVEGVRAGLWDDWAANRELFPRGVDLILVHGAKLAALPRTVAVDTPKED